MMEPDRKNASAYCNYNDVFECYDQLRQPNGLPELLDIFSQVGPVDTLTVLEGGFGTGAYFNALRRHVKTMYGVEGSELGLETTRRKVGDAGNVRLSLGNILDLDFPDQFFDACTVNQVLHHLDTDPDYPNLTLFLKEAWRTLSPGGVLVINTCTRAQLDPFSGVYWNYAFMADVAARMAARYIPVETLIRRMAELGFADIRETVPSGRLFEDRYYTDPSIALEPDFQNGDSLYSLSSPEEREQANARIRAGIADGSVYDQMANAAKKAEECGEAVMISARKPSSP